MHILACVGFVLIETQSDSQHFSEYNEGAGICGVSGNIQALWYWCSRKELVKQIKTGKQSHLSVTSTKKRSILFVSAKLTHSCIKSDLLEGLEARVDTFGDDNNNFNLQQ